MQLTFRDIDWDTLTLRFLPRNNPTQWAGESFLSTNVDTDNAKREYSIADIENDGRWVAVLGDIHGDYEALNTAVQACRVAGIKHMFQVGDFGYLYSYSEKQAPHRHHIDKKMDEMLKEAEDAFGLTLHVIDGNHENHAVWHRGNASREPRKLTEDFDGFNIPSMPLYHPRGNVSVIDLEGGFDTNGDTFGPKKLVVGFLGGARSVNVSPGEEKHLEGSHFWYDEEPTNEDVGYLIESAAKLKFDEGLDMDLLLTHDGPVRDYLVSGLRISDQLEALSLITRDRIKEAVNEIAPELLIHGHWHQWATSAFNGDNGRTKLLCLPQEHRIGNLVFVNAETKEVLVPQGLAKAKKNVDMFSIVDKNEYIRVFG